MSIVMESIKKARDGIKRNDTFLTNLVDELTFMRDLNGEIKMDKQHADLLIRDIGQVLIVNIRVLAKVSEAISDLKYEEKLKNGQDASC